MCELGCDSQTVWKWKNKNVIENKKQLRRRRKLSPKTKTMIKHQLHKKTGSSLRKYARELNDSNRYKQKGKEISYITVQKFVKSTRWAHTAYRLTRKPHMSQKNLDDRLKFGEILQKTGNLSEKILGEE